VKRLRGERRLRAKDIAALRSGTHEDGGGLRLIVEPSGTRRWVLRVTIAGKRRNRGTLSYRSIRPAMSPSTFGEQLVKVLTCQPSSDASAPSRPASARRQALMQLVKQSVREALEAGPKKATCARWRAAGC
jgi:hypothetical protein